jgi:catechol 2,3-dioxygenase-like lactoylglutathione lyase family enzyme
MGVRLTRLDHYAVYVKDVGRAERFYTEILGMERVMRLPDQTLLRLGEQNVGLMEKKDMAAPDRSILDHPFGKSHHAFQVADDDRFDEARAALTQAGVEVSGVVAWPDHRCFYFLDPDGNLLEIVTPPR